VRERRRQQLLTRRISHQHIVLLRRPLLRFSGEAADAYLSSDQRPPGNVRASAADDAHRPSVRGGRLQAGSRSPRDSITVSGGFCVLDGAALTVSEPDAAYLGPKLIRLDFVSGCVQAVCAPPLFRYLCPRSGVEAVMSMQEHPFDAGRKAGRAVAADRRRRGVPEGSVELPPEQMRAVLAENGVTAGQSVAFLRAFWQGVATA
jgi:hypothetical protein